MIMMTKLNLYNNNVVYNNCCTVPTTCGWIVKETVLT